MTEQELNDELQEISKGLRLFDTILNTDYTDGTSKLTEKQSGIVRKLFKLFSSLRFQIKFNNYKNVVFDNEKKAIAKPLGHEIGTPVKVRSCKEKHGDKTYFGILIGDVAQSINISMQGDNDQDCHIGYSHYNPAILIPELNEIVYGFESWWSPIESQEDIEKLISDDVIQNVWYVKLLKGLVKK